MDFAQTNGLSMIGNDDFVTEEQLSGFVTLGTAQTITGDKTLSGTTTITGDITANAVNITPQELGFIGGLTSDAQTQLNGKVGISNDEDITGAKTFTKEVLAGRRAVNQLVRIANAPLGVGYAFIDYRSGGLSGDYDVRMVSEGGSSTPGEVGRGDFTIKSGTNTLDTFTSNTFKVGGTPRITTTSSLTTLSNTAHTINGVTTFDVNPLSATAPTTSNELVNKTYADGKVSKTIADTISAIKTFSVLPESSVVPTTNVQLANKKYVDDTIVAGAFVTLAGTQTITGQKTFTTDLYAAYTSPTQNFRLGNTTAIAPGFTFLDYRSGGGAIDFDARVACQGGTSTIGFGDYSVQAGTTTLDTKTSNTLKINGTPKITTTSTVNTLDNTTSNALQVGGVPKITTTSSNIDFSGDGETCRAIGSSSSNIGFYPTAIAGGLKGMLGFDTDFGGGIMRLRGRGAGVKVDISSESTDGTDAIGIIARSGGGIYINSAGGSGRVQLLVNGGTAKFQATSTTNTLTNDSNDIKSTGGVFNWTSNGIGVTINATNAVNLQLANATKIGLSSSTGTTIFGDSRVAYVSDLQHIQLCSVGNTSFIDFVSGGNSDFDSRLRSDGGTGTAGRGTLSCECDSFIAPRYQVGVVNASLPLLSFQIHGVKQGTGTSGGIVIGPNYDFTGPNITLFYCVPCNIRFMRATLMFDSDGTATGTMNLDFFRKASNAASAGLVHSMGVAYEANGSV
jgi:hypothetical protein